MTESTETAPEVVEDEHLYTVSCYQRGDKVIAKVRAYDEENTEEFVLPPQMAAQLPMALSMMREQLQGE